MCMSDKEIIFSVVLVCLFVSNVTQKLWIEYNEMLWRDPGWWNNKWLNFSSDQALQEICTLWVLRPVIVGPMF